MRPLHFRRGQLHALLRLIEDQSAALVQAVYDDLRKPALEAEGELATVKVDIHETLENLEAWASPDMPSKGILNLLDTVMVRKDPLGMVLIIGPWNYPLNLVLVPLVGALAAGNTVVIKVCSPLTKSYILYYL